MSSSNSKQLWLGYLREHWLIYSVGLLTMLFTNGMQVISTRSLGWVVDFFLDHKVPAWISFKEPENIFYCLFAIILGSRLLLILGRIGWRLTLARQTHHSAGVLKKRLWDRVRFFKKNDLETNYSRGVLMNVSTSDVGMARFIFGFTIVGFTDVIFLGFFTLFALFSIDWKITLASLCVLIFVPWVVGRLSTIEGERFDEAQDKLSEFNDLSAQVVSSIRLQRLTQTGGYWEKRLTASSENYRQKHLKAVFTSLRYIPVMGVSAVLTYTIIFGIGIFAVLKQGMSIGDFVAMQSLIFLLENPLMGLGFVISDIRKAFTSLNRLHEVYNNPLEESLLLHEGRLEKKETVFEVKNLSFAYNRLTPLLQNLNFSVKKGERLGLMGAIGAGKSTLLSVLSGLERNIEGEVLFYGKDFSSYSHTQLREAMGHVPQKPFLFADTIRNNLSLDKKFSDEELWHFLDVAGIKADVEGFPQKLDTSLGEWGINLSGGQKQRMTLARAVARRPQVLFLDDCLSAVDTVTEEKILKALDKELKETTLIWVAHRESTLKYCDRVMRL